MVLKLKKYNFVCTAIPSNNLLTAKLSVIKFISTYLLMSLLPLNSDMKRIKSVSALSHSQFQPSFPVFFTPQIKAL